jgi:crotonobetainyl-CoA:carnitine CoA-transferase CaiB-like acyl-CoA transferase
MNKTRIVGRIIAGAVTSALLLTGALAAPAQAKDTGWGGRSVDSGMTMLKDTGWGGR